jgi:hypothetical protein
VTGRITQADRDRLEERDGNYCNRCGQFGTSTHHRKAGQMGGRSGAEHNQPSNLLALCGDGTRGCHGWVESHRALGYALGWLVPSWADPNEWPVRRSFGWFQPTEDGWEAAGPNEWQRDRLAALIEEGSPHVEV